jgi:hypothetical protein
VALFDVKVEFRVKGGKNLALILDKLSDTILGYKGVVVREKGSSMSIEVREVDDE